MSVKTLSVLLVTLLSISLGMVRQGQAAAKPTTVAEIALYRGPDREQILVEGAKKEGQMLFYNSNTWMSTVAQQFEKKYPFVKISIWRADPAAQVKRIMEEYASGRYLVDVIETNPEFMAALHTKGIFQEYYNPDADYYGDDVKVKGKTGVYYLGDREYYMGLGFNTKQVPLAQTPKTYQDLLDPKWKGKIAIAGESNGPRWVGLILDVMGPEKGREYLAKLAGQDVKILNMSLVALLDLIISGEITMSPTSGNPNVYLSKQKGAPVEWLPLEPAMVMVGLSGLSIKAPHPCTALLFLDYVHSKEGQQLVMQGGLSSPRNDIPAREGKFKKNYLGIKFTPEEYEERYNGWEQLMLRLFVSKK